MRISIRKNVTLAIATYMVIAGVLWGLNYYNSYLINEKLRIIEKKEDLLYAVLEARRYEKNYFLTDDKAHMRAAALFIAQAEDKLEDIIARHAPYAATPNLSASLKQLKEYKRSMMRLANGRIDPAPPHGATGVKTPLPDQADIRPLGREITEMTEKMVQRERQEIGRLIREAKVYHFSALGGLIILSFFGLVFFLFNINRPLKALENAIGEIASGHYENIPAIHAGIEFESLVSSLNHMIDRLNRRSEELIQAKKLASLGTLTSGVAHELNNPLNNISTSIQILLEELTDEDLAFKKELLEGAEKEVERARDIVRALLEFSRQRAFSVKPVSIRALVADTIKLIRGELPANVTLTVNIEEDIQATLDFRRMQQVLLNLIVNGIQAMENGGALTITAFRKDDEFFCFQVIDTGMGIPRDCLGKIFDPFYSTRSGGRPAGSDSRSYDGILEQKGTGLGLAISHGIVEKHHGEIAVDSSPGEGTTFTVCLPTGDAHANVA